MGVSSALNYPLVHHEFVIPWYLTWRELGGNPQAQAQVD